MRFNRLLCVLTLPLCLVWIPSASASWYNTISGANPLHWFRFEEAAGSGTADDQGSADTDGAYVGGVGLGTAGLVGNAASFDGFDDHVLVGGSNLIGDWTVESILKADTVNGGESQGFIGADLTAADPVALKAEQWNQSGQLGYTEYGVIDVIYTDAAAATPADYAHVTFVGTAAGVELFVNGVSLGSDIGYRPLSRHVLGAGAVRGDGSLHDAMTGAIDELVIYDRALAAAEISGHYAAISEPPVPTDIPEANSLAIWCGLGMIAAGLARNRKRRAA